MPITIKELLKQVAKEKNRKRKIKKDKPDPVVFGLRGTKH